MGNKYVTLQKGHPESMQKKKSGDFHSISDSQMDKGLSHSAKPNKTEQIHNY